MHIVQDIHRCSIGQPRTLQLQIDFNKLALESVTHKRRLTVPRAILQPQQRQIHFQRARSQLGRGFALSICANLSRMTEGGSVSAIPQSK